MMTDDEWLKAVKNLVPMTPEEEKRAEKFLSKNLWKLLEQSNKKSKGEK